MFFNVINNSKGGDFSDPLLVSVKTVKGEIFLKFNQVKILSQKKSNDLALKMQQKSIENKNLI